MFLFNIRVKFMDFTLMERGVKVIARDIYDKEAFKEKRFSFRNFLWVIISKTHY